MFSDMFAPSLKTHLHNLKIICKQYLKMHLHHVCRHSCKMFEKIFVQCLKTRLYSVWIFVYAMFEDICTFLHNVCRHVFTIYGDISLQCFKHIYTLFEDMFICLHQVDGFFTKYLKPYWLKIDETQTSLVQMVHWCFKKF